MPHPHTQSSLQDCTQHIRFAFFLNLIFTVVEIAGGIWTNSLAILSDSLHDLGDSLSLGMAWYLEKYSRKCEDRKYSYGYRRFSMLGALINTVVLIAGSLVIFSITLPRLMHPEPPHATGMTLLAVGGIIINGIAALRVLRGRSLNAQIVAWHLIEDFLGWVAILIVSIIFLFKDIFILDAVLSILITGYVLFNVFKRLKKTLRLFLQAVPEGIDLMGIENKILTIDKVKSIHHLHVWSLDGEHHVFTTHVVIDDTSTMRDIQRIRCEINDLLSATDFAHTAVEIECEHDTCRMRNE